MSPKEAATLTARKLSSKDTFRLVLRTTLLLASLKSFRNYLLKRRNSADLNQVRKIIREELDDPSCMSGYVPG